MSLLRETWGNFAARLFDKEIVEKLDTHQDVLDDTGSLLDPVPDPHPQYYHLTEDTAWAGMKLNSDVLLAPGDYVDPFDLVLFPDWRLVTNLATGEITIPQTEGGGYQLSLYFTFEAASSGGTFLFELLANDVPTGFASVADLSNQSDIGSGVIVGFFPVDVTLAAQVLRLRFAALSSKSITMLDVTWTITRLIPSADEVAQQMMVMTGMSGHNIVDGPFNPPTGGPPGPP